MTVGLKKQRGYLLVTVVMGLFLLAAIALMLNHDSAISANTTSKELETARVDYVAAAGMQHALWRAQNNACMGEVTIPDTPLGADVYSATIKDVAAGTLFKLAADQDAWIRSDDVTRNNGTGGSNHIRNETGNIEQVLTRFDVSSIPANAPINSAVAWFRLQALKTHPDAVINVHEITADWAENSVTWESFAGSYGSGRVAMLPAQEVGDVWVPINLTALVQAWVNGQPNYGILFETAAEGVHTEYMSREDGTYPPRLEVVVGSGQASPATINATAKLSTGVVHNAKDKLAVALQPPTTVTLQLGTDPGGDAMLDSFYERNYGGRDFVQVTENTGSWVQRPVFKFGLGAVPMGAAVISAQLELRLKAIKTPGTITVHPVTQDWVEGTLSGTGQADGATWDTFNGIDNWAAEGGDFDASAVAEATIAGTETRVSWEVGSLVNDWLTGEPNNGLLIKSDGILEEAEFYSKEEADATLRPRLTITYACACGTACMSQTGSGNILMVVAEKTGLSPADQAINTMFEGWGYTIELISDKDNQTTFDGGFDRNDVVFVAESVDQTKLGTKVSAAPIGVINGDGWMNDELGFESADSSNWPVGNTVEITDTSHYITAPLAAGSLSIYDADMGGLAVGNTPAPDLQSLAAWGADSGLAVLESDALMANGGSAAGRRVMLPFGRDDSMDWSRLNNNGQLILQRALAWGMGTVKLYAGKLLLVVGDASNPVGKDEDRKELFESWGYAVTLIDDGADQAKFDEETAANNVVYVTASISAATLADKLTASTTAIVNEFFGTLVNFGFASDTGNTVTTDTFFGSYSEHYIAEPFGDNNITVFTTNRVMPVASGTLAPKIRSAAALGTLTWALPTLEEGAKRWDNTPSPGRRVHLPFGDANVSELTDDGKTLMRRALEWAAGAGPKYGLIAHWKLDEGTGVVAVDSVGGHDGTFLNDPAWTDGAIKGGVHFSDEAHAITVPHTETLTITGDLTLLAWVKMDELLPNRPIIQKGTDNTEHNYFFGLYNDNMQFAVSPPGGGWHVKGSGATGITPGSWHHLAVSFDDSADAVAFYLDGVPFAKQELTHSPSEFAGPLKIGRNRFNYGIKGSVDDVRIYRDVLTADEIAELAERPPIAHWKLDETTGTTAVDSEGGHDGVATAGSWESDGIIDGARRMPGNANIRVPHDDALILNEEFTMSAWVTAISTSGYRTIINKGTSGSNQDYWFGVWNNWLTLGFYTGGEFQEVEVEMSDWNPSEPTHFAASFDNANDTIKLYKNGALIKTGATPYEPPPGTEDLIIGRSQLAEFWNGLIDDVRIYDRVLDDDEIAELAAAGGGLVAHWKLDDGTGLTAVDSAGGHDGTLANGPVWVVGQLGDALRFDGSNDRINVPDDDGLDLVSEMTLSAWIHADTLGPFQMVLTKGDNGTDENYWIGTESNRVNFGFVDGGIYAQHTTTGLEIGPGSWHHIAATFDDSANEVKIYVDGVAETFTNTYTPIPNGERLIIGTSYYGEVFDGLIDDVRIYNVVLDTGEIASLVSGGGSGGGGGGGPAPVFESFSEASASSNVTSLNIPKPSGTGSGDLLVAALATDDDSGDTFSPPSGWTEVNVGKSSDNKVSFGVWWKIATSSEPTEYSFNWSGGEEAYGWISRFTGHDASSPIYYSAGALNNINTSAPICQRLNTPVDNMLVLRLGGFDDDDITIGNPGLDGHTAINMNKSGTGNGTVSGGSGYLIQATAGDSGLGYFQLTRNEQMRTVTLGIRPAE